MLRPDYLTRTVADISLDGKKEKPEMSTRLVLLNDSANIRGYSVELTISLWKTDDGRYMTFPSPRSSRQRGRERRRLPCKMHLQSRQLALVGTPEGAIHLSRDAPIPKATGDKILFRTKAVSVNPVDAKMVGPYVTAGAVAGFDFAGTVEQVGPDATKCGFQAGDRVCTAVMGMNSNEPTVGAFAEHTAAFEWILLKLPLHLSFEEGASLGISFMTTGLAIFKSLQVPGLPLDPATQSLPVLVFGGSSSTGTAAIQLLKLAGS